MFLPKELLSLSGYLDRTLLSRFFDGAGQLVPLETFSFMFDLLDDLGALEMLDWICKLQEAGCHYYCPVDSCPIRVCMRPWDSIIGCRYIQAVQSRLRHLDQRLFFGLRLGRCPDCGRKGVEVTVRLPDLWHLWRCCMECFRRYGDAAIVWHKEETDIEGSVAVQVFR